MPESCQKVARKLPESCQRGARKLPEICQKVARKVPESCQKIARKWPESGQKVARKLPESCQKVMRQSWDSHEIVMRQSTPLLQLQALQTCLFLSVQWDIDESRSNRVATRPWLAFQAKAMVKMGLTFRWSNVGCCLSNVYVNLQSVCFYHGLCL